MRQLFELAALEWYIFIGMIATILSSYFQPVTPSIALLRIAGRWWKRPELMLLLFFAFTGNALRAQHVDVRGVVSDSSTGERIAYANVLLAGTARGAATNLTGFFLIPNVEPGAYELVVTAVGYRRRTMQITVEQGSSTALRIELPPEAVEMEEVVISEVSKREISEISTSVHVLDQREMRLVPVAVQEDVFRSILILPGIVSTSDVSSQFYVRGGAADQNLILVDGIRVYSPYHAFGIFSIFDSDLINTSEVYTGAFPPGYGGRLSSVVGLNTKDGRSTGMSAAASVNFLSSTLQLEGPLGEDVRVIANARKSLFTQTFRKFFYEDVPISFYDAFAKVTIEGKESHTRYNALAFFSGDELLATRSGDPDYTWSNMVLGLRATTLFGDRLFVSTLLSSTSSETHRVPTGSPLVTPASSIVRESGIRVDATYYSDRNFLYFFGFEFSFPDMKYELVNSSGLPRSVSGTSPEISSWIRAQVAFGAFQIDAGFHADLAGILLRDLGLEAIQPRANVSYALTSNWRLKLSFGRITQNVFTVNNEDDLISIFDAWVMVPSNMKPEQADHYVIGLEGNILAPLSVSVQAYDKKYSNLVTYNREKVDERDPDYVTASGEAYGLEGLIRFSHKLIDVYTAYTYGHVLITNQGYTYPPRYDRRHTLKFLTSLHPLNNLDFNVRWEYGSGFPFTPTVGFYDRLTLGDIDNGGFVGEIGDPYVRLGEKNVSRLPAYHRLDLSAAYRTLFGPLRLSMGVSAINIYNQKNIFYFDRQTGQRVNMLPFYPTATIELEYRP
jgi:hypothetical protein